MGVEKFGKDAPVEALHFNFEISRRRIVFLSIIVIAISLMTVLLPATAKAASQAPSAVTWTIKGFNFPSWQTGDHPEWQPSSYTNANSPASMSQVVATGANWIALVPTQYMDNVYSNTIAPETVDPNTGVPGSGRTVSDAALIKAIDDAHLKGLKVLIKTHVDLLNGGDCPGEAGVGAWRGCIQPTDPAAWFASYQQMMTHYAQIAKDHGAEMMVVGTELYSMSGSDDPMYSQNPTTFPYYPYWNNLISAMRAIYSGKLTYAASQNEIGETYHVSFSGLLDYLGADIYFPLSNQADPSFATLQNGWTTNNGMYDYNRVAEVDAWQARWQKPVIFTEIGYRSINYDACAPWDFSAGTMWCGDSSVPVTYNGYAQARSYDTFFKVWGNKSYLAGVFWWDWAIDPADGGVGGTGYTLVRKPAESTVKSWFKSAVSPTPSLSLSYVNSFWANLSDLQARKLSVTYTVSNKGGGTAFDASVVSNSSTNKTRILSTLPYTLGTMDPPKPPGAGTNQSFNIVLTYYVPSGVSGYSTTTGFSSKDLENNTRTSSSKANVVTAR